ncbi:MAG: saccharopine dehydrogenase family protein [Candidatus Neomarinimicrobiota bacterium]
MAVKSILILGGYGNAGLAIARLCLQYTDARLTLAGRSQSKAVEASAQLNTEFEDIRVSALQVDASNEVELNRALVGVDLLVVASSTSQYVRTVAAAALSAGSDYLDIQYSTAKVEVLKSMVGEIEAAGRCFITDGGFHPGVPAALVRYAATKIDNLEKAVVSCALKVDWGAFSVGEATAAEFVSEMLDYQLVHYRNGQWRKANLWRTKDFLRMDYGEPIGRAYTVPMLLEEMRALPELIPTLRDTGFYISGFNWFVDWVLFPIGLLALRLWPRAALRPVGRLLFWGMETFSRPPYGIILQLEASGGDEGGARTLRVRLAHEDGYFLTAAPTVACIRQYLDGSAAKPGLHFMAHAVDPVRMLEDMEEMGVKVSIQEENSL